MAIVLGDQNVAFTKESPVVTYTLILLNIIIFIIGNIDPGLIYPGAKTYNDVILALGFRPVYLVEGTHLYTLITSMFLHASILHLLGNMLFLYIFGDNIEFTMGRKNYIIFYIISGIGASIIYTLSYILVPHPLLEAATRATGINPWLIPAIGASGAISGILGAYALFFPHSEVKIAILVFIIPIPTRIPAILFIGMWFIYQLLEGIATMATGLQAGIAFWAHIGGFLTGIAFSTLLADKRRVQYAVTRLI